MGPEQDANRERNALGGSLTVRRTGNGRCHTLARRLWSAGGSGIW